MRNEPPNIADAGIILLPDVGAGAFAWQLGRAELPWNTLASCPSTRRVKPLLATPWIVEDANRVASLRDFQSPVSRSREMAPTHYVAVRMTDMRAVTLATTLVSAEIQRRNGYFLPSARALRRALLGCVEAKAVNVGSHRMPRALDFAIHHVNMFSYPRTEAGLMYARQVSRNLLDEITIAWLYDRRGTLAQALKYMKAAHISKQRHDLAAILVDAIPNPVLDELTSWITDRGQNVVVTAVPSRFGTSESVAMALAQRLTLQSQRQTSSSFSIVERTNFEQEVKDIASWSEREGIAAQLFRAGPDRGALDTVILIDDVVSSGSSLRSCASIIRERGAKVVIAMLLGGSPEDAPAEWFSIHTPLS